MKLFILIILVSVSGCLFHTQAGKKTAKRLVDRSQFMYDKKALDQPVDVKYYSDNVTDSNLNIGDIGTPKTPTNIFDNVAVASDQKSHMTEQKVRSILKATGWNIFGIAASFLGFGAGFIKIKSAYDTIKQQSIKASALYESSVKGVMAYRDKFDDVIGKLPFDDKTKETIHSQLGKSQLYGILGTEAHKTGYGADHHKIVSTIKGS